MTHQKPLQPHSKGKAAAAQDGDVGRAVDGGWSVFGLLEGGQLLIQSY